MGSAKRVGLFWLSRDVQTLSAKVKVKLNFGIGRLAAFQGKNLNLNKKDSSESASRR